MWAAIKAIPAIWQLFKAIMQMVAWWEKSKIEEEKSKVDQAIDAAKNAQTPEEKKNAISYISDHSL